MIERKFIGDSSQQVTENKAVNKTGNIELTQHFCNFCYVESVGCVNPLMHITGGCPVHAFLDEKLRIASQELIKEDGEYMTEDTKPHRNIHEDPTEPLDVVKSPLRNNELPLIEDDEDFEHTTMIMDETILLGKFLDIFNKDTTQSFQQFMEKLKKAIEFAQEKNVDVQLATIPNRVDRTRIEAGRTTVDEATKVVTMNDFIRLYEGLQNEWETQLSVFKKIRDVDKAKIQAGDISEHRLPDTTLRTIINAFVTRHLGIPHQVSLYHPEDLTNGNGQGVNTLRKWVQELIFKEFEI